MKEGILILVVAKILLCNDLRMFVLAKPHAMIGKLLLTFDLIKLEMNLNSSSEGLI